MGAARRIRDYADTRAFWLAHGVDPDVCSYCPEPATSVDHLTARANGGSDDLTNLAPACKTCNSSKGRSFDFDPVIRPEDYVWWVGKVAADDAVVFVKEHHYSRTADKGSLRYGLYFGPYLRGVTIYNAAAYSARASIFGAEHAGLVLHHHRLALDPECPPNSASWFLARAMKMVQRDRPYVKAIITFADAAFGHRGAIYQALNAKYVGVGARSHIFWTTEDGELVSQENLRGLSFRGKKAYAEERGWTQHMSPGKYKYVHLLGKHGTPPLLLPELPYPKVG